MMKNKYFSPEIETVNVSVLNMIAASPDNENGDTTGGGEADGGSDKEVGGSKGFGGSLWND